MLIDDLKLRFVDMDPLIIDKYFPQFENIYKSYYNAGYGVNVNDDEIILNLLAHLITMANVHSDGSNQNTVQSESVGGVSASYSVPIFDNLQNFFNGTIYGQTYLFLTSKRNGAFFV